MRKVALWGALGVAVLTLAGCHHDNPLPGPPPTPLPSPAGSVPAPSDKVVVYVINPKATGDENMLMPRTVALRHPDSPARDAVEGLLRADGSPIPSGISLRGFTIDHGLATLDFSRIPINETGGEAAQSAALNALAQTLGQFPEISRYQIEVKGQPVKSLGEEGAVAGPMDVIRPHAAEQGKETP